MLDKIIVNNLIINKLKPTKSEFINKNNKFSAKGYYNNTKVKIYEVFDPNQGALREFVSNHNDLSLYFPKLITYNSKFIVEEWVNGLTLKESNFKNREHITPFNEVKKIIDLMWSVKYDKQVFDYIDHIHQRLKKTCTFDLSNIPTRINHNDLSLDNILITKEGLKIIDNEFLGCNTGWILNIKNSFLNDDFIHQNLVSEDTVNDLWKVRKEWSIQNYTRQQKKNWSFLNLFKKICLKLKKYV